MPQEGYYEIKRTYQNFKVQLFGREGAEHLFDIRLNIKPKENLVSDLERYCSDNNVPSQPHSRKYCTGKNNNVLEEPTYKTTRYLMEKNKIEITEYFDSSHLTQIGIRGVGKNLEECIESAKSSYEILKPFFQSLGYDTNQFDDYLTSLSVENFRKNRYLTSGPDITDLGLGIMPVLPHIHISSAIFTDERRQGDFVWPNNLFVDLVSHTDTLKEKPSLYASIIMEETQNSAKKYPGGIPLKVAAQLYKEASGYGIQAAEICNSQENPVRALPIENRAIRVLDYLIENIPEEDLRIKFRQDILNLRAETEHDRAMIGSKISLAKNDFDRALRYILRANTFLENFYSEVHKIGLPEFEAPATPQQALDLRVQLEKLGPLYLKAKMTKNSVFESIALRKQEINIQRHCSTNKPTKLSLGEELTLEQQLAHYTGGEDYEKSARVRDAIKKRNLEDPLEFKKTYSI